MNAQCCSIQENKLRRINDYYDAYQTLIWVVDGAKLRKKLKVKSFLVPCLCPAAIEPSLSDPPSLELRPPRRFHRHHRGAAS